MRTVGVGFFLSLVIFSYWFGHGQENIAARYEDLESGVLQHPSLDYAVTTLKRATEIGYYYPTITPIPPIDLKAPQ